jgi:hypothetical protein
MTVTMLLQNTIAAAERQAYPAADESPDFSDFERAIA